MQSAFKKKHLKCCANPSMDYADNQVIHHPLKYLLSFFNFTASILVGVSL